MNILIVLFSFNELYKKFGIYVIINKKLQKMFDMYIERVYNGNRVINNLI